MIKVNLLPYWEEKKKAGIKRQIFILSLSFSLFLIIIASVHIYMVLGINSLEKRVKNAEVRLKKLTQITGDVEKFKKDKAIVMKKLKVITDLEHNRKDPLYLLLEVANGIPQGKIWLTSISEKGDALYLTGIAMDNSAIALFMINLKMSAYINSVDLITSSLATVSNTKVMNFTLSCALRRG
ncbi:MAG: PilN domain-containing protein [Deltaproteobacteria bacterium]|nr:PilN domain-containing protein [Deltaproteobacteria bacterium]